MRRIPSIVTIAFLIAAASSATAQEKEKKGEEVVVPSELELSDEARAELQKAVEKEVAGALKECVSSYPRPEFFTAVFVEYKLKKSGKLSGGYIGGNAPDSNMYVKSDGERAKLEADGSFARLIVRADKDVERCMKKHTGKADSGLNRHAADITAAFDVTWKGKEPKISATRFEIEKRK